MALDPHCGFLWRGLMYGLTTAIAIVGDVCLATRGILWPEVSTRGNVELFFRSSAAIFATRTHHALHSLTLV